MSEFTPAEIAALTAKGIPLTSVVLVEASVGQIQAVPTPATDPAGNPVLLLAFIGGLPHDLIRPRPVVLGADGQPVGGGIAGALPISPTVRILIPIEALSPRYVPSRPVLVVPPVETEEAPSAGPGEPEPGPVYDDGAAET